MKVLYLTPWYPSERDAMAGLFVKKHVEAVQAQGVDVHVIHSEGWCDLWQKWRELKRAWGLPDVVQLNVIQKQGLLALWLKWRYKIPYVVVEHWSGYLPDNGQYMRMSRMKHMLAEKLCAEAYTVLTVSAPLQRAMLQCGLKAKQWGMIDNVVDEFFFKKSEVRSQKSEVRNQKSERKTLLHVSCFDERAKNVKGLLRAARILAEKRQDWCLALVGAGFDYQEVRRYADALHFPQGMLRWTGELAPKQVADEMHRANAFVLSSKYETYGIVLAEAASAGLSIISTPVGIANDLGACIVQQDEVENKPEIFAEKIEQVLFDERESETTQFTQRFTSQAIGRKLKTIYEQVIQVGM